MDSSQPWSTNASSPRSRELQGPRPAPLRVRKDSHKVRKPPVAPQQQHNRAAPIIIYTVSPKIIHTKPDDFMTLVQRLTGADRQQPGSTPYELFDNNSVGTSSNGGLISPAARYAVMDKISTYQQSGLGGGGGEQDHVILGSSTSVHLERSTSNRQFIPSGILSPGPASLAHSSSSSFFSPLSSDPNSMSSFFQGLSPVMNQLIPSPGSSNLFLSHSFISPTAYSLDLFNNFGDL